MSRIAYVNGRYVPHGSAAVHIEDRGYQFADGVYEVVAINGGRFVDEEPHLDRLDRSLRELRIGFTGMVYEEVTRTFRALREEHGVSVHTCDLPLGTPFAAAINSRY